MHELAQIAATVFDVPARFFDDPRGKAKPNWHAVVSPETITEVQAVLAFARDRSVAVVPFGGGTGLVGGQFYMGEGDAIALSMHKFNEIKVDDDSVVVGSGVVLDTLHEALNGTGRHFPLSLASSGSAQIGGLIATNAGGVNVIRHGTMGQLVLGLSVVLSDGTLIDRTGSLKKDNTGYALDRLQIGAEGTLGVVTSARLQTVVDDSERHVVMLPIGGPADALRLLRNMRGLTINAFELISGVGLEFRLDAGFEPAPIGTPTWSVLFEIAGSLDALAEIDQDWEQAIIASNGQQMAALWDIRETIPLGNRHVGAIASHDISVPIERIPDFLTEMDKQLAGDRVRINAFGHLGDGNLHYNLFPLAGADRSEHDAERLSHLVYQTVVDYGGSISAEHGIGRFKAKDLERYGYGDKLAPMRALKHALDPWGIMNPGVFFDPDDA